MRFLDLLGLATPTAADVLALWQRDLGPTTKVALGADDSGLVTVDLARQGPHTMLGGATGAGRSILLQTLVTSLLLANRPDELNLVLVDFKGGSAFLPFQQCPHVVELIRSTGETPADVFDEAAAARVLASVRAEVRRRESLLARYGGEIDEYWKDRGSAPDMPALPRLVMIFDEFARVLETSPDFLKELVNVAAKGRSLGMHLVLATQSLQGELSPELKNNIDLRITLRQTSPPTASKCSVYPMRRPSRAGCGAAPAQVRIVGWPGIGVPRPDEEVDHGDKPTDQQLVITAIEDAARRLGLPAPFDPLLAPPPADLPLDGLARRVSTPPPRTAVPFGLADHPAAQAQPAAHLDLAGSNRLLVAGGPQSGRTTFAHALISGLVTRFHPDHAHLYVIEHQPAGLGAYVGLPHCGGVFSPAEPDRIRRFITWLDGEVQRRKTVQFGQPGKPPPWIVVIDGWEHFENRSDPNFVETSLLGTLRGIVTAGTPLGIHVVAVGGQDMMSGKLPALYSQRILLPFPKEDVRRQHLSSGMVSPPVLPGRAIDAGSGHHVQLARPSLAPQELINLISQRAGPLDLTRRLRTFPALPVQITVAQLPLPDPAPSPTWIPLCIGGPDTATVGVDLIDVGPHLRRRPLRRCDRRLRADHPHPLPGEGFSDSPTLLEDIAGPGALGRHALVLAGDALPIITGQRRSLTRVVTEIMTGGARLLLTPTNRTSAREHGFTFEPDQYFAAPPGRAYLAVGRSTDLIHLATT